TNDVIHVLPSYILLDQLPHWSDAEVAALREQLRQVVSSGWISAPLWPLLGYLEMFPELEAVVASWEDGDVPGGQRMPSEGLVCNLATAELVARHGRRLRMLLDRPESLHSWLYRTGLTALDHVRDSILAQETGYTPGWLLTELCAMTAVELAPLFLELK